MGRGRARGAHRGGGGSRANATSEPSQTTLARMAAIARNREKYLEGMSESGSEEEGGEANGEGATLREQLKNTMKLYYRDLGSAETEGNPYGGV